MNITKEPWEKLFNEQREVWEIWPASIGKGRICSVMNRVAKEEEQIADLIAASPVLLETLKALLSTPTDNVDHYLRAVKDAERAIKEAEGV